MLYTYEYPHMAVTVDAVVFWADHAPKVLLIKRAKPPYEGCWAIPGGFAEMTETLIEAASRELQEETGVEGVDLRFLHYFDAPDRDPRERTLSLAFWGVIKDMPLAQAADDAAELAWHPLDSLPELAFDHARVLERAVREWRLATSARSD